MPKSTLPPDLSTLAKTCLRIASKVAGEAKFVAIWALSEFLRVPVILRPLLVEGAVATPPSGEPAKDADLVVLLDNERYPVDEHVLRQESYGAPLPPRLRYTAAHEFLHVLSLRPLESVVAPTHERDASEKKELMNTVEDYAERIAPFLLIPDDFLEGLFPEKEDADLSVQLLMDFCVRQGVMPRVFVNRLAVAKEIHLRSAQDRVEFLRRPSAKNRAIGVCAWEDGRATRMQKTPIYTSFDGIRPDFLESLSSENGLSPAAVLPGYGLGTPWGDGVRRQALVPVGTTSGGSQGTQMLRFAIALPPSGHSETVFLAELLPECAGP